MFFIAATLTFNAETTTGDSYYIGQQLTVTCKLSNIPAAGSYIFGVSFNTAGSNVHCNWLFQTQEWGELQPAAYPGGIEYHSVQYYPRIGSNQFKVLRR